MHLHRSCRIVFLKTKSRMMKYRLPQASRVSPFCRSARVHPHTSRRIVDHRPSFRNIFSHTRFWVNTNILGGCHFNCYKRPYDGVYHWLIVLFNRFARSVWPICKSVQQRKALSIDMKTKVVQHDNYHNDYYDYHDNYHNENIEKNCSACPESQGIELDNLTTLNLTH